MSLSQALRKLTEAGLLTTLAPRPSPQPIPPLFRMDPHCAYHQGPGHETDRCTALRHAVQDLIDQVPPPADDIHFLDFDEIDDHIHMLSEDDSDPKPIMSDVIYEMSGMTLGPRMLAPFRLVLEAASVQATTVEPLILPHYSVQYIFRGGRLMRQPPPAAARPVEGSRLPPPRGIDSYDDGLPSHMHRRRVPSVLLDNGSALNVCPLATAIVLEYAHSDFGPSTQTVRAYDSTRREVMGTLEIELLIGPATFVAVFQVLRIPTSFNLLLGRPWIHRVGHSFFPSSEGEVYS
ncbi:hypothetical protein CK203_050769 [Vitis vinifera]|uniref:Uncharacterized protein n=1 Tax=Vitis vinifera TaxID=29760 RepID=A0A438HCI5_VITVI|nr:hypothetical protein CK203_050769 [Vitis vinifera]